MGENDTSLAEAARHVRQGQARLEVQAARVKRLERDGPSLLLDAAQALLAALVEFQIAAHEHLARETARSAGAGPAIADHLDAEGRTPRLPSG